MIKTLAKYVHKTDATNFLKVSGTIGWLLSSAAVVGSIGINDKIPTKEKKFLVPQETLDGVINASLFWFFTSKFQHKAEKLIESGKILPYKTLEPAQMQKWSKGVKNWGSVAGSAFAMCLVTPVVRNVLASFFQKRYIKKQAQIVKTPFMPYTFKSNNNKYPKDIYSFLSTAKSGRLKI